MREIKTDLNDILSLISCARDYGFENGVLFDAFAGMMDRKLYDQEIEDFARYLEKEDGYGEEDYESAKECLINFKNKYI